MLESSINGYVAEVSSGLINVRHDNVGIVVGKGKQVQLIESDNIYLYYIDNSNNLIRVSINSNVLISDPINIASNVDGFYAIDVSNVGMSYAYISQSTMHINIAGNVFSMAWPPERLSDFSFDISNDLKTLTILYMKPGSPVQAYIEYYESSDAPPEPETSHFVPNIPSTIYYNYYKDKFENY